MYADLVRQARKARGWTREKLAVEARVSARTIDRVEMGKGVTVDTLTRIADALEFSMRERALCMGAA